MTDVYKRHLFICTNSPEKTGKCGQKGSEQLRKDLKKLCKQESWSKDVRINSAGCLGQCDRGIAAVLYPEGKWFFELESSDAEPLFSAVKQSLERNK